MPSSGPPTETSALTGLPRLPRPVGYLGRGAVAASYPVRGIWYFVRNRDFWPLFTGRLLPLTLISFIVYFLLFAFAFLPQYAFLALFHGWGAWVSAVVLVLGEGLVIIQGLFEGFFVDEARVDVFDVSGKRPLSLSNVVFFFCPVASGPVASGPVLTPHSFSRQH